MMLFRSRPLGVGAESTVAESAQTVKVTKLVERMMAVDLYERRSVKTKAKWSDRLDEDVELDAECGTD
jgi:hypothetical protein